MNSEEKAMDTPKILALLASTAQVIDNAAELISGCTCRRTQQLEDELSKHVRTKIERAWTAEADKVREATAILRQDSCTRCKGVGTVRNCLHDDRELQAAHYMNPALCEAYSQYPCPRCKGDSS